MNPLLIGLVVGGGAWYGLKKLSPSKSDSVAAEEAKPEGDQDPKIVPAPEPEAPKEPFPGNKGNGMVATATTPTRAQTTEKLNKFIVENDIQFQATFRKPCCQSNADQEQAVKDGIKFRPGTLI